MRRRLAAKEAIAETGPTMLHDALIDLALAEDAALGDVTSEAIFEPDHASRGLITAKEELVLAGMPVAMRVFQRVDPMLRLVPLADDGQFLTPGSPVLRMTGSTRSILLAERPALNFLQHLSGIATQAHRYMQVARRFHVRIVDTRKTLPGFRALAKYAVRCGGCHNHRASLADSVLIKDNHIVAAGGIAEAVYKARLRAPHTAKIEVECTTLAEVSEALNCEADIILLDNMSPDQARDAVQLINGAAIAEISGGVNLSTLESYCRTGADVISVGALTHSAPAVDFSLNLEARLSAAEESEKKPQENAEESDDDATEDEAEAS